MFHCLNEILQLLQDPQPPQDLHECVDVDHSYEYGLCNQVQEECSVSQYYICHYFLCIAFAIEFADLLK